MMDYLGDQSGMTTAALKPALEQVTAYLLAWTAREGSFLASPASARLPQDYAAQLDNQLRALLEQIDIPSRIISRHPGVSAVALQSLLNYFRSRSGQVEELLPSSPESDDAYSRLIAIFNRINRQMYQAVLREQHSAPADVQVRGPRGRGAAFERCLHDRPRPKPMRRANVSLWKSRLARARQE
jgi:hypothetical protein